MPSHDFLGPVLSRSLRAVLRRDVLPSCECCDGNGLYTNEYDEEFDCSCCEDTFEEPTAADLFAHPSVRALVAALRRVSGDYTIDEPEWRCVDEALAPFEGVEWSARYREPAAHDLAAYLAADPDRGDSLLRELLRADPDRAVRVVDASKVARAWTALGTNKVRLPLGRPVSDRGPRDSGEDIAAYIGPVEERGKPGAVRSWMYSTALGWSSDAADEEVARTKSDASSNAYGWVLAGGAR